MKNVLIILIMTICTLLGGYFSGKLRQKCRFLKDIEYMLEELRLMIEFELAEAGEIIDRLAKNKRLSELTFLQKISEEIHIGSDIGLLWEKAVECQQYGFLTDEEKEFIKDIGKNLGKSDISGQLNAIKYEKLELEKMIRSADEDNCRKSKLYRSLGVLCGAFIVIMFI